MSRKIRKRFGNLKCATKVEREDSCSLRTTNFILLHSKRQNYQEQNVLITGYKNLKSSAIAEHI